LDFDDVDGQNDSGLHDIDVPLATTSRALAFQEFCDCIKKLLREACIGEPPDFVGMEETYVALKQYW